MSNSKECLNKKVCFALPFELIDLIIMNDNDDPCVIIPIMKYIGGNNLEDFINSGIKKYKCFYMGKPLLKSNYISHYFDGISYGKNIKYYNIDGEESEVHKYYPNTIYYQKDFNKPNELRYVTEMYIDSKYEYVYNSNTKIYNIETKYDNLIVMFTLKWINYKYIKNNHLSQVNVNSPKIWNNIFPCFHNGFHNEILTYQYTITYRLDMTLFLTKSKLGYNISEIKIHGEHMFPVLVITSSQSDNNFGFTMSSKDVKKLLDDKTETRIEDDISPQIDNSFSSLENNLPDNIINDNNEIDYLSDPSEISDTRHLFSYNYIQDILRSDYSNDKNKKLNEFVIKVYNIYEKHKNMDDYVKINIK